MSDAPLDLRAVERDLHQTWPDREGLRVMYDHAMALLAHARALRAVLQDVQLHAILPHTTEPKIAAVLATAQDGPA